MVKILSSVLIMILISLPLISAYNGWGYGFSPSQIFENEWVVFTLVFLIFFAIIFFSLGKTMKENVGAAAVISAAISLFIAFAISQRARYYGFLGSTIGSWLLILGIIVAVIFLIKVLMGAVGLAGLLIGLWAIWGVFSALDPYDILPYEFLNPTILNIYELIAGFWFGGLILSVITVILISTWWRRRRAYGLPKNHPFYHPFYR